MLQIGAAIAQLVKDFHLQCIRRGKLILDLHALFFPDMALNPDLTDEDLPFFKDFWQHIGVSDSPNKVFIYSAIGLSQCFVEGGIDCLQEAFQEMQKREEQVLPGFAFHLGLAAMLYQREKLSTNAYTSEDESLLYILRKALIDIIQSPLLVSHFIAHYEIIKLLLPHHNFSSIRMRQWEHVNNVVNNLHKARQNHVQQAIFTLLMATDILRGTYGEKACMRSMRSYLRVHPHALNKLIEEAIQKHLHFFKSKRAETLPLLWHLAILDEWKYEGFSIPDAFPQTIKWLGVFERKNFVGFLHKAEEYRTYFDLLTGSSLPQFLLAFIELFPLIDKQAQMSPQRSMHLLRILLGREKADREALVAILESIDSERHLFFLLHPNHLKNFGNMLLTYYSQEDIKKKSYANIHTFAQNHFTTESAQRAAYLLLLHLRLEEVSHEDFPQLIQLMHQRFEIDPYRGTLHDIALLLIKIASSQYEQILDSLLKGEDRKKELGFVFLNHFLDLFQETFSIVEEEHRAHLLHWLQRALRVLDKHAVVSMADRLKKIGITIRALDKRKTVTFISSQPFALDLPTKTLSGELTFKNYRPRQGELWTRPDIEVYVQNRLEGQGQQWKLDLIYRWRQFAKTSLATDGYIPMFYHSGHGYGVLYIESVDASTGLTYSHDLLLNDLQQSNVSLLIMFHPTLPHAVYSFMSNQLGDIFRLAIIKKVPDHELTKIRQAIRANLNGTSLEGAIIDFLPTKIFSFDTHPERLLISGESRYQALSLPQNYYLI